MKKLYYIFFLSVFALQGFSQSSENYIMTIFPRIPISDIQVDSNLNTNILPDHAFITIDYHDGLGRPIQHIEKQASPQGKDIITLRKYNTYGKERRIYLSFPDPTQTSGFRINHNTGYNKAKDYYRTNCNDENCISEVDFEKSPLFRISREGGFGEDWQITNGHVIDYYEGANNKSSSSTYDPRHFEWTESGIYKRDRFKNLKLEMSTDEDNNVQMYFFDKDGKLMVERRIVSSKNLTTYYLYDEIGRLRAVLPPIAATYLENKGTTGKFSPKNTDTLAMYAYFYNYDERGNCTEKYLPGLHEHPVYIIYDVMNRPVLTQDGELRKSNQWKYQKYDVLGRTTESGVHTTTLSFAVLKTTIKNQTYCYETRSGKYYTNRSYPTNSKTVLITNYYDDYETVPKLGFGVQVRLGMLDPDEVEHSFDYEYKDGYSLCASSAKGQLTMKEVALLDGTKPMVSVFYYDEKGRLVQERSENRIGGYDYIFYKLDFSGDILKKRHEHYSDYTNLFQTYYYTYDNQGRMTKIEHGLDDNAIMLTEHVKTLAIYTYDELGKLKTKHLYPDNPSQMLNYAVNYNYHIQGQLKQISSPYFTETLYYGNEASKNGALLSTTGYKAAYNGNITTKITESVKREGSSWDDIYQYNYKYDQADRLTNAVYYNFYDNDLDQFSVTNMTYDRNGNIETLRREGITQKRNSGSTYSTGVVDQLTYAYDGNRLKRIDDTDETSVVYTGIQTYLPLFDPVWDNVYDANGCLIFSGDNGLSIENNIFNLPKRIEDIDGNIIEIIYDAEGQKTAYRDYSTPSQSKVYHSNMIFKMDTLSYMALPEGYYDGHSYFATITDYLGSVRVVLKDNPTAYNMVSEVKEVNHYDPWGVEFARSLSPFGVQDYKHQGKERLNIHGKNYHDHGARFAEFSRWISPDPLAEQYYWTSPYTYCNNNPVLFVDKNGMEYSRNDWGMDFQNRMNHEESIASNSNDNDEDNDNNSEENLIVIDLPVVDIIDQPSNKRDNILESGVTLALFISQLDSPVPGIADAVGLAVAGVTVAIWGTMTIKDKIIDNYSPHRKNKSPSKRQKHTKTRSGGDPEQGRYGKNRNDKKGNKNQKFIPSANPNKK